MIIIPRDEAKEELENGVDLVQWKRDSFAYATWEGDVTLLQLWGIGLACVGATVQVLACSLYLHKQLQPNS